MRTIVLAIMMALVCVTSSRALEPIPDKLVVLTFDDASRSHVEVAAPLLKKHGFGATFFITEGFDFPTNKRDYMTWEEVAQLNRDGFEIGNHTRDHKPPSSKDAKETLAQLAAIDAKCAEHGIPKPVSFAYPGNALDKDVLALLRQHGIKFARRGGAPEYPYEKGQGFAYEPGIDHPLLIPSAGDGRPNWTLDNFKQAVNQARGGKIAVIQLHGVPDTAHSWVNTPKAVFESYVRYLAENGYKVIAMRDLAKYVDPDQVPKDPWEVIEKRKAALATNTTHTRANVPVEISFTANNVPNDPFTDFELDVMFKTPLGGALRVPAFWAGGKTWKVRYASREIGVHAYVTLANFAELNGKPGRVEVEAYQGENLLYKLGPVRVADDKRHMAYADGTPFFWLGDTWWMGLCHRMKFPEDFATLTADRRTKGFNVVQIVAGLYPDMPPFDPRGANEAGFPWDPKFERIRPEYFDAADARLQYLVDQGITPCIVGMWGYFLPEMGVAKAKAHWRYLIARYGSWPVVWCVAGEANLPYYLAKGFPYDSREQVHGWTEVMKYVRATDPFHRPVTIHPTAINKYTSRHATDDPALLDFDMLQTPHGQREAAGITLQAVRESYAALPKMPVIDGEAAYEKLSDSLPTEWTRAMFWICMAEGAAGHTYGANGIWQVNRKGQPHGKSPHGGSYGLISWDEAMVLPGSGQIAAGKAFLEKRGWTKFEPHPEWVAWDGGDAAQPPALGKWIWFPEGDSSKDAPVAPRYFTRKFELPADRAIKRARLRLGADDRYEAWVNDASVGSGGSWLDPLLVDVATRLKPGVNHLAIRAENMPAPVKLNPAGLTAALEIEFADGNKLRIETGASWQSSKSEFPGWRTGANTEDTKPAREIGPMGIAPWGMPQSRPAFPPLAFGDPSATRVFYMLDCKPVVIKGLEPGRMYRVESFDTVQGQAASAGEIKADASGTARPSVPAHGHDWVLALTP